MISVLQEPPEQESALPDKLFVSEALDLYSSFYTDPADWWPLVKTRGLDSKKDEMFKKLSGGQSSGCPSRLRSSATRGSPCLTS